MRDNVVSCNKWINGLVIIFCTQLNNVMIMMEVKLLLYIYTIINV